MSKEIERLKAEKISEGCKFNCVAFNNALLLKLVKMEDKVISSSGLVVPTSGMAEDMDRGIVISQGPLAFAEYDKYYGLERPNLVGKTVVFEIVPTDEMYFNYSAIDGNKYKVVLDENIRCIEE